MKSSRECNFTGDSPKWEYQRCFITVQVNSLKCALERQHYDPIKLSALVQLLEKQYLISFFKATEVPTNHFPMCGGKKNQWRFLQIEFAACLTSFRTHTRAHVLAALLSLFTICTNGVFLKCFWSLRYKSERFELFVNPI